MRGSAALAVIGCHLRVPGMGFGWSGVQLFFVLSGFLITGILVADRDKPNYFATFYARRSLRIFPIYYLSLALFLVVDLLQRNDVSDWPYFFTYSQNWLYTFSDTWDDDGRIKFTWAESHTWSLAIEEQFYLLWPLAVRFLGRAGLTRLTLALIVVGPVSRYLFMHATGNWWTAYAPLPCEVDMLAWGALGALLYASPAYDARIAKRVAMVVLAAGFAASALPCILYGPAVLDTPLVATPKRQVFFALLGPFYLALIFASMSGGVIGHCAETKPLRYCGRISYGLYLYHWPILVFLTPVTGEGPVLMLAVVVLTFIVGAASYRWIEKPLLKLKDEFFPRITAETTKPAKVLRRLFILLSNVKMRR